MKTIKTALPLPAQVMVQFFRDKKNIGFEIDYDQSLANLRSPGPILQYLANLNLTQKSSLNTKKISCELLTHYVKMRDVCKVSELLDVHANVLYFLKYGEVLYPDALELFNYDDIVMFVKDNARLLVIQAALLNSIPLYVATSHTTDVDGDRSKHELVKTVDEKVHPEISVSLFNLFGHKEFLIRYLEETVPMDDQIYFKPHYDKPMYVGKTMFGWFAVPGNQYFNLYQHISDLAHTGPGRFELTELYLTLLNGNNDDDALSMFNEQIKDSGSIKNLLKLSNRDVAAINKTQRKAKKRAKKAAR